jgi:ABC-type multidrug transport system fused ATPase/permease subunit
VGNNGSGKSTILKLISRLYDPSEGHIFIDGIDIKTIRLADLRRAISVLFQDYTLFPLSVSLGLRHILFTLLNLEQIHDNISLGDPRHATDQSKIQQAAQLGGAASFIESLPDKYDSYLERPVQDYYSSPPEGTTTFFGQLVDYGKLRQAVGSWLGQSDGLSGNRGLSGGQMQRIALWVFFFQLIVLS